jgi:hypothetical protein
MGDKTLYRLSPSRLVADRSRQEPAPKASASAKEESVRSRALLSYYRSCLAAAENTDPKADWGEVGERFVPIRLSGSWWPGAGRPSTFSVARTLLPQAFQQAVGHSKAGAIHLGYPLDVFRAGAGLMVRAICSVPLRWKVTTSDVIVFETIETTVSLNSGWMNFYRKHLDIKALADRIASGFPTGGTEDGEGDVALAQPVDLEDLCAALNLGFAKRRNGDLRPGSTEATLSTKPGLHNVAAFFVTSSARYSEVAIQDLDALAKQTEEQHCRTALGTIFGLAPPTIVEPKNGS